MAQIVRESTTRRRTFIALTASVVLLFSSATMAAEHRAKLSTDLTKQMSSGSRESSSVILSLPPEAVDAIAARIGAKVTKRLRHQSVLRVTPEQLLALSTDPAVP